MRRPLFTLAIVSISLIWFGALIGHSFVATPAKFAAVSLTRPVALDVGRATFAVFAKVEWALCAMLVLAVVASGVKNVRGVLVAGLVAAVLVQALWLLPALNARAAAVIAGSPLPPSLHHAAYATAELLKMAQLAALAGAGLWRITEAGGQTAGRDSV